MQSQKQHSSVDSSQAMSKPAVDRLSEISCECQQWSSRRRCSASPEPQGRDDKENELEMDWPSHCGGDKRACEDMEYEDCSKTMFLDEDSNQILPVEQFFGNMDAVQDFPQQRPSAPSTGVQREQRRRRYYAQEDSEEDGEVDHSRTTQSGHSEEDRTMAL